MSYFDALPMMPDDPILNLNVSFGADSRSNKVNLGVGSYKTGEGTPMVLSAVKKAEALLLEKNLNKEYLPIDGDKEFIQEALKIIYGKDFPPLKRGEICGVQTIGGTGALRVGSELIAARNISKTIFVSDPTWPNHKGIFSQVGLKVDLYPYYDQVAHRLDFTGMCESIKRMPKGSVIVLHACCHNPTGIDPDFDQWKELSKIIKNQQLIPFFDFAYQGFGNGLEEDAKAVRYFADQGHEMLVASSFSKNFGLYGERVGLLSFVAHNKETAAKVCSQLKSLIRCNYSTPPSHGVRIVKTILQDPSLHKEWDQELGNMRERIREMRKALVGELLTREDHKDFSFMNRQQGIFSYSGLDLDQVHRLRQEYGIFMPSNGRINVAGLNWHNLNYVVDAILSVL